MAPRLPRVNAQLRERLSAVLQEELRDPRVQLVTITRVATSADLQHARVFISCLGNPAEQQASLAVLRRAKGFVRRELGRRIRMRYTPDLVFVLDDSAARLLAMDAQLYPPQADAP